MEARSLDEVRANIDRLDEAIVALIAERATFVRQAARFKTSAAEVAAPDRVEQVLKKVRSLAADAGLEPHVANAAYKAMIDAFIDIENKALRRIPD